jgi:hypothetical protein
MALATLVALPAACGSDDDGDANSSAAGAAGMDAGPAAGVADAPAAGVHATAGRGSGGLAAGGSGGSAGAEPSGGIAGGTSGGGGVAPSGGASGDGGTGDQCLGELEECTSGQCCAGYSCVLDYQTYECRLLCERFEDCDTDCCLANEPTDPRVCWPSQYCF